MSDVVISRKLQFCAGHRVHEHESKCRNLHGHNYTVHVRIVSRRAECKLDGLGRVLDFSVVKKKVGAWLDQHWDHGFVLWREDREAILAVKQLSGQKLYLMPTNPTAENMAMFLLYEILPDLLRDDPVVPCGVELWETDNCMAKVGV